MKTLFTLFAVLFLLPALASAQCTECGCKSKCDAKCDCPAHKKAR